MTFLQPRAASRFQIAMLFDRAAAQFARIAAVVGILVATGIATTAPAVAQAQYCAQYRAELAQIDAGGGDNSRRFAAAAQRQRGELAQLSGQYRALGCERSRFALFGDAPPAQCGAIGARIRQLQQSSAGYAQAGQNNGARRAQLIGAINTYCRQAPTVAAAPQPRGFLDQLFGRPNARYEVDDEREPIEARPGQKPGVVLEEEDGTVIKRFGGGRLVCVRTCDGFFFPLANSPGGRDGADEMCGALCPGAEARAYSMAPDGDVDQAISLSGERYSSLPNASRFKTSFDATCSCKPPGQNWATALREAEERLGQRGSSDIIVTAAKADELSRVPQETDKPVLRDQIRRDRDAAREAARKEREAARSPRRPTIAEQLDTPPKPLSATEEPSPLPLGGPAPTGLATMAPAAGIPTAIGDASNIRIDLPDNPTIDQRAGKREETTDAQGVRRSVRVVGPPLANGQSQAAAPPSPGRVQVR